MWSTWELIIALSWCHHCRVKVISTWVWTNTLQSHTWITVSSRVLHTPLCVARTSGGTSHGTLCCRKMSHSVILSQWIRRELVSSSGHMGERDSGGLWEIKWFSLHLHCKVNGSPAQVKGESEFQSILQAGSASPGWKHQYSWVRGFCMWMGGSLGVTPASAPKVNLQ